VFSSKLGREKEEKKKRTAMLFAIKMFCRVMLERDFQVS
jgi:hypothetical protein